MIYTYKNSTYVGEVVSYSIRTPKAGCDKADYKDKETKLRSDSELRCAS